MISARLSKKLTKGFPFSFGSIVTAIPKSSANTIICSMFPSTMALRGLLGTIFKTVSISFGATVASAAASVGILRPAPGLKIFPSTSPIVTANAVVNR